MSNYRLNPLKDIDENKNRIIENTRQRMKQMDARPTRTIWKPTFITVLACLLCLVLATPYLDQTFQGSPTTFSIKKVIIPNVPYDSLINSVYLDESHELIYSTKQGIYSFNVEKKESKQLTSTAQVGRVFDFTASPNWLIWAAPEENKDVIHILDRQTNEIRIVNNNYFFGLYLSGNTLVFMGSDKGHAYYFTLALDTLKEEVLHEIKGEGANSPPVVSDNLIVIPEVNTINKKKETVLYVYDINTHKQITTYTFPYGIAENVQLLEDTIYAYLWNGEETGKVGAIDRKTGKFSVIKMPVTATAYATDGEHFALSVARGESDTVHLFRKDDNKLKLSSKLPSIKERLVNPRFSSKGTLVLNGEGKDRAVFIIRFDE